MDPALHQPPPADPGGLFSSASQLSAKQRRQRSVITTMWNIHFLFYCYIIDVICFWWCLAGPRVTRIIQIMMILLITTRNDWNVLFVFWDWRKLGDWRFKDVFPLHSSLPMVKKNPNSCGADNFYHCHCMDVLGAFSKMCMLTVFMNFLTARERRRIMHCRFN